MSWAADNPEMYNEICRRGVLAMLRKKVSLHQSLEEDDEAYALDQLSADPYLRRVWEFLMSHSNKEICDAESAYFSSMVP